MEKIVIAFGGNALLQEGEQRNYEVQYAHAVSAIEKIAQILRENKVVITHGNGPQVGDILLSQETAKMETTLHQSVAMSQGYIEEILLNAYSVVNARKKIGKEAIAVITRVLVDPKDPAFKNPDKPIGRAYAQSSISELRKKGWVLRKTDEGWRRVVPSPMPKKIIEINMIKRLLEADFIPIAAGGGGIPVIARRGALAGVDAVIDKDLASSLLASDVKAHTLLLLTNVDYAYLDFESSKRRAIKRMSVSEAKQYLREGQFEEGSMAPKVLAGIKFIEKGGERAIIASLQNAQEAFYNDKGTVIEK